MNPSNDQEPTLAACLTPPGAAAIATLALCGPAALEIASGCFTPGSGSQNSLKERAAAGRFWFGKMGQGVGDEVVLAVREMAPRPWIEVHCHGGHESSRMLLELFKSRGALECSWQDLLTRTSGDQAAITALTLLSRAKTLTTARILLQQSQGALQQEVRAIRGLIQAGDRSARQRLRVLQERAPIGRHLVQSWRVVLAGAPNVGKSSLMNALAGYRRSLVSATPGTTRDLVTSELAFHGWPVEISDSAGLHDGGSRIESAGMRLAEQTMVKADLCLWILDAGSTPVWPGKPQANRRLIINKIDLPSEWVSEAHAEYLCVSALTGEGIDRLVEAIPAWLIPEPPPDGAGVPLTKECCLAIDRSLAALDQDDTVAALEWLEHAQ